MATKTLIKDRNSTWKIDGNDGVWKVTESSSIKTKNEYGIEELIGATGNRIIVNGDIHSVNARCIQSYGVGTELTVGSNSVLKGLVGVVAQGDDNTVTNHGKIVAESIAMSSGGVQSSVTNQGSLFATVGITSTADNAVLINGKHGEIEGATGISTACDVSLKIVNKGEIRGTSNAILVSDGFNDVGTTHVINKGKMFGTVNLGNGDDVFDTRKGTVNAAILGGDGDDTFYVSRKSVKISEEDGDGSDSVISTASFKLSAQVENLTLVGDKDLRGEGSNVGNIIIGNKGDNKLFGFGGVDLLNGGEGNDQLNGGDDELLDLFIFNRGTGDDIVVDFEDGIDRVMLGNYDGIDGMEDFEIVEAGSDTRLVLKDGDTVLIKGVMAANFSEQDVVFEIF